MFICCKKNLHVREGGEELNLQSGYVGPIDDRWAGHWYVKAAMADGTIVASGEERAEGGKGKKAGKPAVPVEPSNPAPEEAQDRAE